MISNLKKFFGIGRDRRTTSGGGAAGGELGPGPAALAAGRGGGHHRAPPPPPPRPGRLADFGPLRLISRGRFAKMWAGVERRGGGGEEPVALKQIRLAGLGPKTERELYAELELLGSLTHPNIVRLRDAFLEPTWHKNAGGRQTPTANLFTVMDILEDGDLALFIQANAGPPANPFHEAVVWHLFARISAGVAYIHSRDVLHRELKPANVLLSHDLRTVKLADFGVNRFARPYNHRETLRLYYMSPEEFDQADYGKAADVWGLGCLLYECAALHSPFSEETSNLERLGRLIRKGQYPPLPKAYSHRLHSTVRRCLFPEPEKRPTAAAVHRWAAERDEQMKWEASPEAVAYWASIGQTSAA